MARLIAHGIVGRTDLPIPEWLFGWAAAIVLVVSFVALAVLWPEPRLQDGASRPAGGCPARSPSRAIDVALRRHRRRSLLGWSSDAGFERRADPDGQLRVEVRVRGLLARARAASACCSATSSGVQPVAGARPGRGRDRPDRGGRPAARAARSTPSGWATGPAVAGLFAFTTLELVAAEGEHAAERGDRRARLLGRHVRGAWRSTASTPGSSKGEAFCVYFNLFSRISPVDAPRRAGRACAGRCRAWPRSEPLPGTVPLLAVMIGSVTFDGAAEAPLWTGIAPDIPEFFVSTWACRPRTRWRSRSRSACCLAIGARLRLLPAGHRRRRAASAATFRAASWRDAFVHSLVPIAFAYVAAHYLTLLLYQGQAI